MGGVDPAGGSAEDHRAPGGRGYSRKKLTARIEWERGQSEASDSWIAGLAGDAPELCADAMRARHCWQFCEGWNPDRFPVYAALYPVADWHLLIDLMQTIRRNL
jgi:hypothetical protein